MDDTTIKGTRCCITIIAEVTRFFEVDLTADIIDSSVSILPEAH